MAKKIRLKQPTRWHALLLALGLLLSADGYAMECAPGCCCPAAPKPKWHSVVMPVRTNLPAIHFYNKINPIWWFGNADEPHAPEWYRPDSRFRDVAWHFRNPLANFSNYVIGIGDKKSVRSGWYPTKIGNPCGGWNYAVSQRHILYLPFIDYKHGRFEFYFGWRERGNFGIKLNFRQAPPRLHRQNNTDQPTSVISPSQIIPNDNPTMGKPATSQSEESKSGKPLIP